MKSLFCKQYKPILSLYKMCIYLGKICNRKVSFLRHRYKGSTKDLHKGEMSENTPILAQGKSSKKAQKSGLFIQIKIWINFNGRSSHW